MATSGTTSYNLSQDDIIVQAYDRIGGKDISGYDLKRGRDAVNLLLIDLQNRMIPIWKLSLKSKTLVSGTDSYTLDDGVDGVLDAVFRDASDVDIGATRLSLIEYNLISAKTQTGRPTQYMIQRGRDNVELTVWPVPDSNDYSFEYWAIERIEDGGGIRNTLDISYRFLPALIFGLSYYLSFNRQGVPKDYVMLLKEEYEAHLMRASDDYRERTSWEIKPKVPKVW
jgi:hypothetical protein